MPNFRSACWVGLILLFSGGCADSQESKTHENQETAVDEETAVEEDTSTDTETGTTETADDTDSAVVQLYKPS